MKLNYSVLLCFTFLISCTQKEDKINSRTKQNINNSWFYLAHATEEIDSARAQLDWTSIDLPHTWNNEDVLDSEPGYRRTTSWYKKDILLNEVYENDTYLLYFEGSNITTTVYVNGEEAGGHIGGYIGFEIDITTFIKTGTNEIYVKVDNGYNPDIIPSQKSDFFIYGGITRDVWLITKPKQSIGKIKLTTPNVSQESASLEIDVPLALNEDITDLKLHVFLRNPEGKIISSEIENVTGNAIKVNFKSIQQPKLWDIDSPKLYTVDVYLKKGEEELDNVSERVGFRWFEFVENGPFYLNGKRVLLRGTHRHEEHAGVGAAMSNELHRKDIELIKEMGANFVRLAHYPQDPEIYKACDELGLLVWDELPWCRGGLGGEIWQSNTKNMLREIIDQNYNHPSVIIWSLGNEMYWLPDFENGNDTEKMNTFLTKLNTIAHTMDPSRKTAIRKYYEGANIVDVFSPSIWSGWYSGSYKSYQKAIDTYKPLYKSFLHAEYGGSSQVGRHTENPITGEGVISSDGWEEAIVQTKAANIAQIGDWSENYIVDLFDWHLRISETDSSFVGNAQWAFKDFGTPLRPENDIPYLNQKGLVDRSGNPKDAFYVFKSYWAKKPFAYIESHSWTERQGPEGLAREISVFSNCKEVTLFHNGKSLGTRTKDISKFPASGLTWNIQFSEGKNELIAKANIENGEMVEDILEVNYRYTKNNVAEELVLTAKKMENGNFMVTAVAIDENGLRCLDYEDKVYFQTLEGGHSIKNQGTPTGSEIISMANGKASLEIKPDDTKTTLKVMVMNQNFKGTYLTIAE
ncbi:beta-galactosidase [Maribacter spongiicola]|uniref:Beta-galactosidase n=1 Tax=Maribacter spongiicola TaxID=1206753 RepID=A0A4V6Q2S4_9FLAO|nr:glycoside hydrolase family 2 TIM barrel-domain containing protein [Maribacter spongiicola]TDT47363.1 beta-galactosidase [Maribacter spongiicola]